ncbi:MAG TPA: nuclear transport factor 2 family protein [Rhizomicrobium sp.]|jgi:hypothetical protein
MIAALLVLAVQAGAVACAPPSASVLRARDQALLDAFVPGDRKIWDETLSPDAVYVDENGAIMPRAAFLKTLIPLGSGSSGVLRIVDYRLRAEGGTALVIHRDDERENYHGIMLKAGYLTTETWLCQAGMWKLAMIHTYVEARDPPAVAATPAVLGAYAGRYVAAPDLVWSIRLSGDHLVGQREGKPPHPLLMEAPDLFFIPGEPREKRLFQRDAAGRITGFVERREGEDILWRRAS